jgi:hypothetical protein
MRARVPFEAANFVGGEVGVLQSDDAAVGALVHLQFVEAGRNGLHSQSICYNTPIFSTISTPGYAKPTQTDNALPRYLPQKSIKRVGFEGILWFFWKKINILPLLKFLLLLGVSFCGATAANGRSNGTVYVRISGLRGQRWVGWLILDLISWLASGRELCVWVGCLNEVEEKENDVLTSETAGMKERELLQVGGDLTPNQ